MRNYWYLLVPAGALLLASCSKKPSADFTASANTVSQGEVVTFSDASENAVFYHWDFGDGSPAAEHRNPTHVYADDGTYTVTLEVSDRRYKEVSTYSEDIIVEPGSADDPFAAGESERIAVREQLAGFWNIDRFSYDVYYNGIHDPQQSVDAQYTNSNYDFFDEEQAIHQYETGQIQIENWDVISAERVMLQWQIWNVDLLGENDFVISWEQVWEDWQGNETRQVQKMYMSR